METRKNEVKYSTLEPKKLLNRYIAERVLKIYTDDFIDEDTGETVSIERNEILFSTGTFIDQDVLAKIRFSIEAGEITKDIEVSNQKRMAYVYENTFLYPYLSQVKIGNKKKKILFYANSLETALLIIKDYVELNYEGSFSVAMIKEFPSCIILIDKFKKPEQEDTEEEKDNRKYYQIEAKIQCEEDEPGVTYPFIVYTLNVDRAMMLITEYMNKQEEDRFKKALEKGEDYEKKVITSMVEEAKLISVGDFISKEFSEAYL